jgi:hypothetical protein
MALAELYNQEMSAGDVYVAAINNGATPEQAQLIAQRYAQSPGTWVGGDVQAYDNSDNAKQTDAFGYGLNAFPGSDFARYTRERSPTFKDSFEDAAGFAAKSAALYAGASALGGAGAAGGAGGSSAAGSAGAGEAAAGAGGAAAGGAGAGATDASYLAAADASGGAVPAYGSSSSYAAGIGKGGGMALTNADWINLASKGAELYSNSQAQKAQQGSTDAAAAEQRRQFDLIYSDQAPYREAGKRALATYEGEINRMPTADEVMSQPGYQFGLQQGQLALDRKAAASGGRVSGEALKRAAMYGTDYATTGFNAEYQRRQDRLNRLASLQNLGQTSTQASSQAGQNRANAITGLLTNQGDATAAGRIAQGNIWGNAINQAGAAYGRQNPQGTAKTGNYDWTGSQEYF